MEFFLISLRIHIIMILTYSLYNITYSTLVDSTQMQIKITLQCDVILKILTSSCWSFSFNCYTRVEKKNLLLYFLKSHSTFCMLTLGLHSDWVCTTKFYVCSACNKKFFSIFTQVDLQWKSAKIYLLFIYIKRHKLYQIIQLCI